jgi:hypothetical protein
MTERAQLDLFLVDLPPCGELGCPGYGVKENDNTKRCLKCSRYAPARVKSTHKIPV